MTVNGKTITLEQQITVAELLTRQGLSIQHVAVEVNGKIVPKAEFEIATLMDRDEVEIVSFVGGG